MDWSTKHTAPSMKRCVQALLCSMSARPHPFPRLHLLVCKQMVSKVYKEFMITGFISFSLLMLLQFGASLPFKAILMFEIGHIWVFLIAIMFVTHVVFFMLLVRKTKRHWDATSHMDVDDLLAQYALLLRARHCIRCCLLCLLLTRCSPCGSLFTKPGIATVHFASAHSCGTTSLGAASCARRWGFTLQSTCF